MRSVTMKAMMATTMLAVLAGCGPADEAGNRAASVAAPAGPVAAATTVAAGTMDATAADSHAVPAMGAVKTFGDWTVGCDNGGACMMASLLPEGQIDDSPTMSVTRDAGLPGALRVAVTTRDSAEANTVTVDGKPVGGTTRDGIFTGDAAAGIVAAMANAATMQARGGNSAAIGTISLKGASAALRYIDERQGRTGTTSAIVATGKATTPPPTPALPVIVALSPTGDVARPSAAQVTAMRKQAECDLPDGVDATPQTAAIGAGKTLVMLPCSTGAYNLSSALFVMDDAGVTPARTDAVSGFTEGDTPGPIAFVVNGDVADGVLTSYAKGRGIGDCGVSQSFVWDGTMLRLSKQEIMDECRGNTDTIPVWRTRVVRR